MCGISGLIDGRLLRSPSELKKVAAEMADQMIRRGPDMAGVWADAAAGISLSHRRLSILDLSEDGRQPKSSSSGRYVITFNGEIYNFQALKVELQATGARFRGRSDTEVLLAAIESWGLEDSLRRISGMFAFAVWDCKTRKLHLARDRVGKKPLYYGHAGDTFVFASELKAIYAVPEFEGKVSRDALTAYFRRAYVPAPHSIWENIFKLPPGTYLTLDCNRLGKTLPTPIPYWSWRETVDQAQSIAPFHSDEAAVDALEDRVRVAVRDRMVADVPVGAFLSGGIDSSVVTALMQQESSGPVRTFTIGFNEAEFDESSAASRVAEYIGTTHCDLMLSAASARNIIPDLATIYDEPFADPSAVPMLHVSRLARADVTVCLSGDGGDELFGGYGRYALAQNLGKRLDEFPRWIRRVAGSGIGVVPVPFLDAALRHFPNRVPDGLRGDISGDRIHKLAALLESESGDVLYQKMTSLHLHPETLVAGGRDLPARAIAPLSDKLHRMMYCDSVEYLPDDILVKVDRATMFYGLEARSPLLDRSVIELAWQMSPELLWRDGRGKWPLRQLYNRLLPNLPQDKAKQGFSVPISEWLRGPLREWAEDLLEPGKIDAAGLLVSGPIRKMWHEHISGNRNWGAQLWAVLMFCSWHEKWCGKSRSASAYLPEELAA